MVGLETSASFELLKVECEPPRIMSIEPGETRVFEFKVTALEGTASGDYILELKAVSRETEAAQMRITVSPSRTQFLTVGVVVAAAFASIIFVYKKFKRR